MCQTPRIPYNKESMKAIKDLFFIVSVKGHAVFKYEFFNQAVFEQTHLTQDDLGKSFHEAHNPATARLLTEQYNEVVKTVANVEYKDAYNSSSGEFRYSKTTLIPLSNGTADCAYIIGVVKDITQEQLAGISNGEGWEGLKESRSRYRSLYENNTDAIFSLDLKGRILGGNLAVEKLTGCSLNDLIGTEVLKHIPQNDAELMRTYFRLALDGVSKDFRTNFSGESRKQIGVLLHFSPVEVNQKVVGIYATLKDMTELDKLATQYVESENRFRIIAENAHDVIVLMNHKGETIYVSPSSKRVFGFEPSEYMQKPPFDNVHPDDIFLFREAYSLAILEEKTYILEIRLHHKTRGWIWAEVQGTPVFNEQQQFIHMLTITQDITLHKERENQLHHYAYHDSLTSLPNRRFLKDFLTERINQSFEKEEILTVILLDIDHFKDINDQFGHENGDYVIEEFGKRLKQSIGENDFAARLGGDEFILVLPDIKTELQARNIAEKVQQAMRNMWQIENGFVEVTVSMGVALTSLTGTTVSSVLKNADLAMYESKKAGRDMYCIHHF